MNNKQLVYSKFLKDRLRNFERFRSSMLERDYIREYHNFVSDTYRQCMIINDYLSLVDKNPETEEIPYEPVQIFEDIKMLK